MPIRGAIRREMPCVSHTDAPEILLIRISHWLWRWYRDENRPTYLSEAIDDMARVKHEFREPLRANREASAERMRAVSNARKSQR